MIQFYTTSACHLCELAEAMLDEINLTVQMIEIANDDDLVTRYGTAIPVLKRLDTKAELNWPFSTSDILKLIE
jgi:hypothetical protein